MLRASALILCVGMLVGSLLTLPQKMWAQGNACNASNIDICYGEPQFTDDEISGTYTFLVYEYLTFDCLAGMTTYCTVCEWDIFQSYNGGNNTYTVISNMYDTDSGLSCGSTGNGATYEVYAAGLQYDTTYQLVSRSKVAVPSTGCSNPVLTDYSIEDSTTFNRPAP